VYGLSERKRKDMMTLTCPSEDDGIGASAEGTIGAGFSFCFFSVLFGGGGIIGASSEDSGTSTLVDTVLSELIFAFFEGGSMSLSELVNKH
jgi:hypothetical protein